MGDKEDYLTPYRVFFENFAKTVNPEDQLPVNIAGYTITESELTGEVLYWITQYLTEKQCPLTLMTPLRRIILDEVQTASKKYPNDFGYKSDEAVYIALRLMQAVTARVNDVCLRYLDNARLDTLPPPLPLAQRDLKTVSCAYKNSRRVMEDRHVEIGNLEALFGIETTEPTSFYAVYDGHAGSAAATYCAAHLHQYLVESPHFSSDLTRAMRDAFLRTDADFIRKSDQERACGGSTAVAVTIRGRRLLAAWAGDSLAFLAKRMRLMQLVRPHKPSRQDERDRIEKSGGTVMYWGTWRVNGQLAVSRAIGDAQYKPYVTAKPEHATVDLDGDEDFVVVACDGLWDFVSEDDVALSVYRQIGTDPDDLKAVTKRLIVQAKRQGSADNISIIVVFLKDPRDIAADNRPPMDLGLDNALANAPPFAGDTEACKRAVDAAAAAAGADAEADTEANADNGVDNSDSDSEDLGPETAVDADDIDADARNHEPAPPTPPAHTVEEGHVVGALVDNVAESGDESEDEWNYFKGEGEREDNPSEEPDEAPRSDTPCQDNSAWETSSVDMNSSPLNPDAPVFIPGSVGGPDVLLAQSPRKPLPMDDIELPDVAQFETEAVVRPAELLDLDNCDQLNGHHNASIEIKEHLNGNDKCLDSLGFGFNVGIEPDKVKDSSLIQDFERIQKDTTDFCNIQVFQTHTETNPFAETFEGNNELFERLKNKERDPMSMSFYQEKDDDTCERLSKSALHVDLNAVQPLPDSDDEDLQTNGNSDNDNEKENISPDQHIDLFGSQDSQEPNNDIMRFDDRTENLLNNIASFGQADNCNDYSATNNMQPFSDIDFESSNIPQDTVLQTDTPESHKLLFEQIPEIPDGKSSELGFTNDDLLDTESERNERVITPQEETSQLSQDTEDSKRGDSPANNPDEINMEIEQGITQMDQDQIVHFEDDKDIKKPYEYELILEAQRASSEQLPISPAPQEKSEAITPEPTHETEQADILVHENAEPQSDDVKDTIEQKIEAEVEAPQILLENERLSPEVEVELTAASPLPPRSPFESVSPAPHEIELPSESPIPSPLPTEPSLPRESPLPTESIASPVPTDASLPRDSPLPVEMLPRESPLPTESPLPQEVLLPAESPLPDALEAEPVRDSPPPSESPLPQEVSLPAESPAPVESIESQTSRTPLPEEIIQPIASPMPVEEAQIQIEAASIDAAAEPTSELTEAPSPVEAPATEVLAPSESPVPAASPAPIASDGPVASPIPTEPEVERLAMLEAPIEAVTEVPLAALERTPSPGAPAPDLLSQAERITDIDIGVSESRAQEICVPLTCEIRPEDGERPAAAVTPPSTPAVLPPAAAPLAAAAAALAATAAVTAVATTAAKKTPATKKPSTPSSKTDVRTPKSAPKAAAPRTPASAPKRPTTAPAARTPLSAPRAASARTSATKPAAPKPAAPVAKTPPPIRAPSKVAAATAAPKPAPAPAAPATKPVPKPAAPRAAPVPRSAPAPKPLAARPAAPKPAVTKSAPAARPAAARPASAPARPAPRPAPAPARKAPEKKPLPNGDAKETKPAPITRPTAARPPAPRPAPRAAAPLPPATTRSAAPKPASRAPPLDKQSKDLANKRITAKAAPPRTTATKVPSTKTAVSKVSNKKSAESAAVNGLSNGAEAPGKAPPSPPAHDNATLPDVIA